MAILDDTERAGVWAEIMQLLSGQRDTITLTKPELRAAVDAADAWAEANKASYNSALPLPARTNLTATQKALVLAYVILRRYLKGA